jgi:hypothetical protein
LKKKISKIFTPQYLAEAENLVGPREKKISKFSAPPWLPEAEILVSIEKKNLNFSAP